MSKGKPTEAGKVRDIKTSIKAQPLEFWRWPRLVREMAVGSTSRLGAAVRELVAEGFLVKVKGGYLPANLVKPQS